MAVTSGVALAVDPPALINYQGVLRDSAGFPLSGDYAMIFRFFDAKTDGNELLVDEHLAAGTGAVTVTNGMFNVPLGSGNVVDGVGPGTYATLRDVFRRHAEVYLQIEVESPGATDAMEAMSLRVVIVAPPYVPVEPDTACADFENRVVDCGNGTVTDTHTGLIWLKDAYCPDAWYYPMGHWPNWVEATDVVAQLADGQCGLTDGSQPGHWRLPTKDEWLAILDSNCPDPYPRIPDLTGLACYNDGPWATGVQANYYHSSTTYEPIPANAWAGRTNWGALSWGAKTAGVGLVWPVRDGSGQ
jgi:hypothetical protein